ncbi:SGNH/GDSL hydrolase family protein [Actinokineospora globicatena]|uniref:SGNH/GDSL hydrolase family protein n=1 Tax=Actinokineospora globicatena TaxID=103729 RepID=UPI0020A3420B|nr:SGNH/GDSL hydrolase family protein [Actinokineospora globicatena]MCP2305798.1 GDSL-like Lipase/Acylhydrolase family protein [Actinokineospora globicatena]GLW80346.1 lipase [Actinokineospora globicatena]GLW87174.1 lipase [Actinokineospora globicatena]
MRRAHVTRLAAAVVAVFCAATVPAQAAPQAPFQWVALGDSYAAGVIPAAGVELPVPGGRDGCSRTAGSYPEVLRVRLAAVYDLTNVSCGGATIANLFNESQEPTGYHLPFFDVLDPGYPFRPVPPQIDAVSESTNLVTIGVGGNTFGFAEVIYACLQLGASADKDTDHPCADAFTTGGDGVPTVNDRLAAVSQQYGELIEMIKAQAPNVTVVAVGYPAIIPEDVSTCAYGYGPEALRDFATATYPDLSWLRSDVLIRLNDVIAQQAATHNAVYVDTFAGTEGHDVCRPEGTNWIEGILDNSGGWALIHPNAAGHLRIADLVEAALPLN